MLVLTNSTPVTVVKEAASENAEIGENGENSKNRDEDLETNLAQVSYI